MKDLTMLLHGPRDMSFLNRGDICLIGCSTSEVIGEKIGTVGSMEVAETIFGALDVVSEEAGVTFAFQGCEHINGVITIERSQSNPLIIEEVSVVPDVHAEGSLVIYALQHTKDPIVVEHVTVPRGIDTGQTLIGMYTEHACVSVRTSVR